MIAYFDEATKELLVSAKGKALNTIIVKLFNPMEIEVRVGTEVKNPLPKDVDFKKWPLNANYKYYLKASVTVSA